MRRSGLSSQQGRSQICVVGAVCACIALASCSDAQSLNCTLAGVSNGVTFELTEVYSRHPGTLEIRACVQERCHDYVHDSSHFIHGVALPVENLSAKPVRVSIQVHDRSGRTAF